MDPHAAHARARTGAWQSTPLVTHASGGASGVAAPAPAAQLLNDDARHAVYREAADVMQDWFWSDLGAAGRVYLCGQRQIAPEVAEAGGVGFVPSAPTNAKWAVSSRLADALLGRGVSREVLVAANLAVPVRAGQTPNDLADVPVGGGYLAFPVADAAGRLLGFKYRAVDGAVREEALRQTGTKGMALGAVMFGLARVPAEAREVIAVEGETDQLSIDTAAFHSPDGAAIPPAIATHGKELTDDRLRQLAGRFDRVLYMYDNDRGGWIGMLRGGRKLARAGVDIALLAMPDGMDPNDVLKAPGFGPVALAQLIREGTRESLLEAHARVLVERGIAETDPVWATRALAETAAAIGPRHLTAAQVTAAAAAADLPVGPLLAARDAGVVAGAVHGMTGAVTTAAAASHPAATAQATTDVVARVRSTTGVRTTPGAVPGGATVSTTAVSAA